MPTWLKKIVLDIMPSVAATIIGAYIVNYYIIPKSPAASRPAIGSTESKPVDGIAADASASDKMPADRMSGEKSSFEKAVAEKTAIEKTAEKAASDKAIADKTASDKTSGTVSGEPRKAALKTSAKSAVAAAEPGSDEHRSNTMRVNELARAAIERLRTPNHADSSKPDLKPDVKDVKVEPGKTPDAPRVQTVSAVATPAVPPMQPLPPAINVTTPNAEVFEQGASAPVVRQPYPQAASRADDRSRFSPPADIPSSRPLDLRAQASAESSDRGSIADEVFSTAKSMFHAVIPR